MSTPLLIGGDCEYVAAWSPTDYVPTPETEPEAIAADQRGVVAFALRGYPRRTPEQISELVLLPVWVVRRRLAELGKGPPVEPPVRTKKSAAAYYDRLREKLKKALAHEEVMTTDELAAKVKAPYRDVIKALANGPELFEAAGYWPLNQPGHKKKWRLTKGRKSW